MGADGAMVVYEGEIITVPALLRTVRIGLCNSLPCGLNRWR